MRRRAARSVSNDRYFLVTKNMRKEAMHHAKLSALIEAQRAAELSKTETEIVVLRRPLLGQEHVVYRVVREKEGVVLTHAEED